MILVYAVCDQPDLPAQAPLDAVRVGNLLAVFSDQARAPDEPGVDALWAYEHVVEDLMAERTVLPMRFGTALPDAGVLREAIAAQHDALVERLEFVRDRVELGVRAIGTPPALTAAEKPTGREYLLTRLGTDRAAAELHEPLAACAVASSRRAGAVGELLHATYLVDKDDVAPFIGTVDRLRGEHPDLDLLCTGPWPPYSFVRSLS